MKKLFKIFSLALMLNCGVTASAQELKGYDKAPIEREKSDAGISSSELEVARSQSKANVGLIANE